MRVLLDLDGVLVDFVGGACRLHGKPDPYADGTFHDWYVVPKFGMSAGEFWRPMGREFWANLDWTSDGREILAIAERAVGPENICLLSSPCLTEGCFDGKLDWIAKHLPQYNRRFLIGPRKEFCASRDSVLVDDSDDNIDAFKEAGGHTILVPRPWNAFRRDHAISYVEWEFSNLQ